MQEALLPQLSSSRLAVRKRSITALSYLLVNCNQLLLNKTINILLTELTNNANGKTSISMVRTYIQCIASISRQAGHRFGDHLKDVMPLVAHFCKNDDDELREYCLQAFESFVRRCPKEIQPYVPDVSNLDSVCNCRIITRCFQIIATCLVCICHDPNYNYDDAEDEEMEMDNEDENESNDEYSDDDDMSWKVRRAAAKCIEAIISTRHDMVIEFYQRLSQPLIARFKGKQAPQCRSLLLTEIF